MKLSSRIFEIAQSIGLTCLIAAGAACTANSDQAPGVDTATSDLKGGVPANGKDKNKNKGQAGQAGSVACADDDAGVDEAQGDDKGKAKKDKVKKTKSHADTAGASGGKADEDEDESTDEANDDGNADETPHDSHNCK
jgi:hypothetical protein